ncbi:MAG: insulinase family protein [Pyrinomonadaceae bacterium]|nr:insulinase family protein [Pyrinomonadaceae bacterium]
MMNIQQTFKRSIFLTLAISALAIFSFAQNISFDEPREEKLLNELKVLIWKQPNDGKVSVKLRIHSGAAFDPKDKMGTMVLLGDILFPEEGLKTFFEEDLEGKLEIETTYDYIQINATAKQDELLSVLETIAPAVINPEINKELTSKVKLKQLEKLKTLDKNSAYVADRAAAKKLLGDFPYGRPLEGTMESVAGIDFADIILARQRFLTSDNATLTITGDVRSNFAYRAARRLFGGWTKSNEKVPSSFRLPGKPDTSVAPIPNEGNNKIDLVHAINGVSRRDGDYFSSRILEKILVNRTKEDGDTAASAIRQDSHLLKGIYFMKAQLELEGVNPSQENLGIGNVGNLFKLVLKNKISSDEFRTAKSAVVRETAGKAAADIWLDIDTYRLRSVKDEMKRLSSVSIKDIQTLADKLANEPHVAVVMVPAKTVSIDQDRNPDDPK